MGATKIKEIFDSFVAMDVMIGGRAARCAAPTDTLNAYQTAHLPIRVLNPINRYSSNMFYSTDTWNINLGSGVNQMHWTIVDVLLFEAINQTQGLKAINGQIIDYVKDYTTKLADGALNLPENAFVESVSIKPDVIEYPLASNNFFYGVITIVQIKEKVA
jgi:hypothetical protein